MKTFFTLSLMIVAVAVLAGLILACSAEPASALNPPYPPSTVITDVQWFWGTHQQEAPGSDLWPTTWGADGNIYSSWGDGGGFGGTNSDGRVSLGFARIQGPPETYVGINVWGGRNPENPATFGGKTAGMISVDGILYAWLNTQDGNPPDHELAWSTDFGATWQRSSWSFPSSGTFFPATFLNFGKDNAGARDEYVYSYGGKWIWAQGPENNVYLMRVHKTEMLDRGAYEFYAGLDTSENPIWSSDVDQRQPVFSDPNGVGNAGLSAVSYNPGLGRYLLTTAHRPPGEPLMRTVGRLGIFDAPEPWGPWTTVAYYANWGGYGDNLYSLGYYFPTKWISPDGTDLWMIYSSSDDLDSFNLVKLGLITASPQAER